MSQLAEAIDGRYFGAEESVEVRSSVAMWVCNNSQESLYQMQIMLNAFSL